MTLFSSKPVLIPFRLLTFLAAAAWPGWCAWQVASGRAGPDPGNFLLQHMGIGTLVMLLIVLAVGPLYALIRWQGLLLVRRQLGLWCFGYAVLHLLCYLLFIIGLSLSTALADLTQRPYIIVGMLAFVCLAALAASSPKYIAHRWGKAWKSIHRLIYVALVLGLLHFLWIVRADMGQWWRYAIIGGFLLLLRLPPIAAWLRQLREPKSAAPEQG